MLTRRSRATRFVILFPGRVGSTYLVSALDARPDVNAKGERLDPLRNDGAGAQLDWTRRFLRGPLLGPYRAIGFKTKLRDVLDPDGFAAVLRDLEVRVVFLDRRNDVKHAISRITARRLKDRTGRWNRYANDPRDDSAGDDLGAVVVDPVDFAARLEAVEAEKATIADYVARLAPPHLHVDYEDLLADPATTFGELLAFLRLSRGALEGATLKNTSDDLREAVANFDELRARYVGTRYEAMFDEVLVTRP